MTSSLLTASIDVLVLKGNVTCAYDTNSGCNQEMVYMQWQEVCENKSLKNLPFNIELNNRGKVLMTSVYNESFNSTGEKYWSFISKSY